MMMIKVYLGLYSLGLLAIFINQFHHDELIDAIKVALKGGSPMSPQIARKVLKSFHKFKPQFEDDRLTEKEESILILLAEGKSYKTIAEEIYSFC